VSVLFFFSSRRRHTRSKRDWSSDVCSSDLKVSSVAKLLKDWPVTTTCARKYSCITKNPPAPLKMKCCAILYSSTLSRLCSKARKIGRASCREGVQEGRVATNSEKTYGNE